MNRAVDISNYLIWEKTDRMSIQALAGALLNRLSIHKPIPLDKFAEVVEESRIPLNIVPERPVIKMAKSEHVEAFFRDGTLRLGTFSYYNEFDHEEIGDRTEGSFILVGQHPQITAFAEIRCGFNYYVFCCYSGNADDACIHRFGYDSSYRIVEVEAFAIAIQKCMGAISYRFSECAYSKDKVVIGEVGSDFDFRVMSARLIDLVNEAKYFVKPITYSHQSEFRFTWQMPSDVNVPLDIKCPEAIQFCER